MAASKKKVERTNGTRPKSSGGRSSEARAEAVTKPRNASNHEVRGAGAISTVTAGSPTGPNGRGAAPRTVVAMAMDSGVGFSDPGRRAMTEQHSLSGRDAVPSAAPPRGNPPALPVPIATFTV